MSAEGIEEEIDGDLKLMISPDSRYFELEVSCNRAMTPDDFFSVIEFICKEYADDPVRFVNEFSSIIGKDFRAQ